MTSRAPFAIVAALVMAPFAFAESDNNRRLLSFDSLSADLGTVKSAGILEKQFKYTSVMEAPVELVDVRSSCGCLTPIIDKRQLNGKESGTLTLRIHAASQKPGAHRYTTTVVAKNVRGEIEQTELAVTVNLQNDLKIEPATMLIYHNGRDKLSQKIQITDARGKKLPIVSVASSSEKIQTTLRSSEEPGKTIIDSSIAGNFDVGRTDAKIAIRTADPDYPLIEIPVTIVRQQRFTALPERVRIVRDSQQSNSLSRSVYLRDARGKPIRILDAHCEHHDIELTWSKESASLPKLTVTSKQQASDVETLVQVRLVEPENATVFVPVLVQNTNSASPLR